MRRADQDLSDEDAALIAGLGPYERSCLRALRFAPYFIAHDHPVPKRLVALGLARLGHSPGGSDQLRVTREGGRIADLVVHLEDARAAARA